MTDDLRPEVLSKRICAAWRLYENPAVGQSRVDRALYALGKSVVEWDFDTVLVMAAAVNHLYNAGHQRLVRAADHIAEAKRSGRLEPRCGAADIVKAIGPLEAGRSACQHLPFASKFAHFFVRQDIPLYDRWVVTAVDHHLGEVPCEPDSTYRTFVERVRSLHELAGFPGYRQIDWYLWLYGMLRSWRDCIGDEAGIRELGLSRQVRAWFVSEDPEIRDVLDGILLEAPSP